MLFKKNDTYWIYDYETNKKIYIGLDHVSATHQKNYPIFPMSGEYFNMINPTNMVYHCDKHHILLIILDNDKLHIYYYADYLVTMPLYKTITLPYNIKPVKITMVNMETIYCFEEDGQKLNIYPIKLDCNGQIKYTIKNYMIVGNVDEYKLISSQCVIIKQNNGTIQRILLTALCEFDVISLNNMCRNIQSQNNILDNIFYATLDKIVYLNKNNNISIKDLSIHGMYNEYEIEIQKKILYVGVNGDGTSIVCIDNMGDILLYRKDFYNNAPKIPDYLGTINIMNNYIMHKKDNSVWIYCNNVLHVVGYGWFGSYNKIDLDIDFDICLMNSTFGISKWSPEYHKYMDKKRNDIIKHVILCNRHMKNRQYKIPKYVLYMIINYCVAV